MGSAHRHGSGFSASNPIDSMWDAMDQLRAEFDKRVAPRMGRGDVRAAVLALLHEEPMHGYQIIREIEERSDGRWKPSAGSVYPTLQLLADEGRVTAEHTQDRKIYSLTDAGRQEAEAAAASAPWAPKSTGDRQHQQAVAKAGFELAQAATQAARSGTSEQQEKVVEALHETRRKIYMILAQD